MHQHLKRVVLGLSAALLASACIVVPAENHTAPPPMNNAPPPPPPAYGDQQQPPPNSYGQPSEYGQQQPPPQNGYGEAQPGTTVVVYYEEPSPEPISYYEPSVIWFYGPHPVTPGYGYGWCPIRGGHTHNYEPAWQDRYEFWNGYYYYLGDPSAYDQHVSYYIYIGAHPNPWGGWCYSTVEHRHYYTPRRNDPYRYDNARFQYSGSYDQTYYSQRNGYDNSGHRVGGNANVEHRTYQASHATPTHGAAATHEVIPASHDQGHGSGTTREEHGQPAFNGHENHETHPANPIVETPAGSHPTMLIHGREPAPTPTPAAVRQQPIATPAAVRQQPAATPTPAPMRIGPGNRAAPSPTPAMNPGTVTRATPTPTPTPRTRKF